MADGVKRVHVRIGGMTYALVSAEDEQYTRQVGARADEMIRRVLQSNPQLSQSMATVLALVNAVDDMTRLYNRMQSHDSRQQEQDQQSRAMRQELQRLREQNWDLKKDVLELRSLCREYESQLAAWRSRPDSREHQETSQEPSPEAVEAASDRGSDTGDIEQKAANGQPGQPEPDPDMRPLTQTHIDDYLNHRDPRKPPPSEENSELSHDT